MKAGFTLIETMLVVAVLGVMALLSAPSLNQWAENERLRSSALQVSAALSYARSEAVRTGNVHLVLFQEDAQGNTLSTPILVVDDGRPGSSDQNCEIDTGEPTRGFGLEDDVSFGVNHASGKVSVDAGASSITDGSTFENAAGNAATWVLFRPEGRPLAFSSDCTLGTLGSGGGGIYLTNGDRDLAVVLTPLGSLRMHGWRTGGWSS